MDKNPVTVQEIVANINPAGTTWLKKAMERTSQLVMPPRALGRLHAISEKICAIQKTLQPDVTRKAVLIMAGDHGIMEEGYSPFPQEVTREMIRTFLKGGAGINALASCVGAEVEVIDLGVVPDLDPGDLEGGHRLTVCKIARGTANFSRRPAMTREDAEQSILTGFEKAGELIAQGVQILGTGDMGIGNTSPSAAIGSVLTKTPLRSMVGRGTGVDDPGLDKKLEAVERGIRINQPDAGDGLDVLAKVGGFEIGGIAGCLLAGAYNRVPVVLDGFISTAGALIAHSLSPRVLDYCFAGHCSQEKGHRFMLDFLGLEPILDLEMRLGEGTGAALAMSVIEAGVSMFNRVLTFTEAGVSGAV